MSGSVNELLVSAGCQGQPVGKCRTSLRADRASRPGTLINCVRTVPVVALAWNAGAITAAVRVGLNAIAAQTSQGAVGPELPDGRWASGPFLRSAR